MWGNGLDSLNESQLLGRTKGVLKYPKMCRTFSLLLQNILLFAAEHSLFLLLNILSFLQSILSLLHNILSSLLNILSAAEYSPFCCRIFPFFCRAVSSLSLTQKPLPNGPHIPSKSCTNKPHSHPRNLLGTAGNPHPWGSIWGEQGFWGAGFGGSRDLGGRILGG